MKVATVILVLTFMQPLKIQDPRLTKVVMNLNRTSDMTRGEVLKDVGAFVGGGLLAEGVNSIGTTIRNENKKRIIDYSFDIMEIHDLN